MKRIMIRLGFPALALTLCCGMAFGQKSRSNYHEDLSVLRPRFEATLDTGKQVNPREKAAFTPTLTVNAKVDTVLDSINRFNRTRKFTDGFTIQVYSGQNKEEAMNTKKKLSAEVSDLNAELQYTQPKFRVRVGSYYSRLEAQKDLLRLKKVFPNAILVPEKIMLR
jgi:cell division protein FtsN